MLARQAMGEERKAGARRQRQLAVHQVAEDMHVEYTKTVENAVQRRLHLLQVLEN